MIYNTKNPVDKERSKERFAKLIEKEARIELTEKKGNKTPKQNRYLHLILGWFALETGYTLEYVKREFFKIHCNLEIFKVVVEGKFGDVEDLRSWSELASGEATTAINRFRNWSAQEAGIYLPEANELEILNSIEQELSRKSNKEYF
ncbi:hypothetical protein PL373_16700 [Tenacibaculum maritimum]|nr:hypothetical protein [Tenacibaculum maritimum]MDB0602735.1 hypothetical protein [Tenacibaculum maritimum]MDB0612337.1 hypothetical protein [Tenacibaculum maritimum]